MAESIDLLVLGAPAATVERIERAVGPFAGLVGASPHLDGAVEHADAYPARIVLVAVDDDPERGFDVVRRLAAAHPARPVVVLSSSGAPDHVLRAMRAGARDYALLDDDLAEVVRAVAALAQAPAAGATGRVAAVLAAKGGSGATTVATNLAHAARLGGARVALVDVHLQLGGCLLSLDLAAPAPLSDVIRRLPHLDGDALAALAAVHASGVHVFAQGDRIEDCPQVTPERVAALLKLLRRHYDLTVVDGLRPFDDLAVAVLDASDAIFLLFTQDVPGAQAARRCLEVFRRLDYPEARIHPVLTRHDRAQAPAAEVIAQSLGRPLAARVANDFRTVVEAINHGVPLQDAAGRARVTADIAALVALAVDGAPAPAADDEPRRRKTRGLLSGLLSRGKVQDGVG